MLLVWSVGVFWLGCNLCKRRMGQKYKRKGEEAENKYNEKFGKIEQNYVKELARCDEKNVSLKNENDKLIEKISEMVERDKHKQEYVADIERKLKGVGKVEIKNKSDIAKKISKMNLSVSSREEMEKKSRVGRLNEKM